MAEPTQVDKAMAILTARESGDSDLVAAMLDGQDARDLITGLVLVAEALMEIGEQSTGETRAAMLQAVALHYGQ